MNFPQQQQFPQQQTQALDLNALAQVRVKQMEQKVSLILTLATNFLMKDKACTIPEAFDQAEEFFAEFDRRFLQPPKERREIL